MSRPFDELLLPGSSRDGAPLPLLDAAGWLTGASSREILEKLTRGDPLGLELRCALQLRERALLVARERLVARALAQIAFHARSYREWQPMDLWLRLRINQALDALVLRDREDERAGQPPEDNAAWSFLTDALGIPRGLARRSAVAFNDLPAVVRAAFWRVIVEGVSEARCVHEGEGLATEWKERVERALITLSIGADPGGADPHELEVPRG